MPQSAGSPVNSLNVGKPQAVQELCCCQPKVIEQFKCGKEENEQKIKIKREVVSFSYFSEGGLVIMFHVEVL